MITRLFRIGILTIAFPVLLSFVVYYGYGTNYTRGVFHESGFRQQYEQGVYKYRVLGPILLLHTYRFMGSESRVVGVARRAFVKMPLAAQAVDPEANALFYASFFAINTFFLVLASSVLYALLTFQSDEDLWSIQSSQMIGVFLIVMAQYVVTPYDTLSCFLFLLSCLLIVRPFKGSYVLLLFVLGVSTLVRESSALTLSFFFAFRFREIMKLERTELGQLVGLLGTFLATYISVRYCLGANHAVYESVGLRQNLSTHGLAGLLTLPAVSYAICAGSAKLTRCLVFLAVSAPYILGMAVIALTWEIRLWVPIWLAVLVLRKDFAEVPPRARLRVI